MLVVLAVMLGGLIGGLVGSLHLAARRQPPHRLLTFFAGEVSGTQMGASKAESGSAPSGREAASTWSTGADFASHEETWRRQLGLVRDTVRQELVLRRWIGELVR